MEPLSDRARELREDLNELQASRLADYRKWIRRDTWFLRAMRIAGLYFLYMFVWSMANESWWPAGVYLVLAAVYPYALGTGARKSIALWQTRHEEVLAELPRDALGRLQLREDDE